METIKLLINGVVEECAVTVIRDKTYVKLPNPKGEDYFREEASVVDGIHFFFGVGKGSDMLFQFKEVKD